MKKEGIKSIILVLLIISNLVLAEKILVNKKLWPSGYNFFNIGNNQKNDHSVAGQLAVPEKIFVNTGYQSSRFEYLRTNDEFSSIYSVSNKILKTAFAMPSKSLVEVSSESWYSALTSKSVYLSYSTGFSAQIFAELLGISGTEMPFENFSDIVISENGNVYICDNGGSAFYKIESTDQEILPIIENEAEKHENEESVINYSFDLFFDKGLGDQKTTIAHMIPIYSEPISANAIVSENPIITDGEINDRAISGIVTAFSINPSTVRRYTEADGSLVYVENNGILKISTNGILTYTANAPGGIQLAGGNNITVSHIAEFVDRVNSSFGADIDMTVSSSLAQAAPSVFSFDYMINGLPIKYHKGNAVTVTVSGGYVTEYIQVLRLYESTQEPHQSTLYIEALDNVILKYQNSMSAIKITKMQPAYPDDLTIGKKVPDWYIAIDNVLAE